MLGDRGEQVYGSSSYIRSADFIGIVKRSEPEAAAAASVPAAERAAADHPGAAEKIQEGQQLRFTVTVSQRGNFGVGDVVELIPPEGPVKQFRIDTMRNGDGENIERAPHPCMDVLLTLPFSAPEGALLRRRHTDTAGNI